MDDIAARIIENSQLIQKPASPDTTQPNRQQTNRTKLGRKAHLNAPTVYENVIQSGTKTIQAKILTLPNKDPPKMITVIAANTNWK